MLTLAPTTCQASDLFRGVLIAATAQAEGRVVDLQKLAAGDRDARVIAEKDLAKIKKELK